MRTEERTHKKGSIQILVRSPMRTKDVMMALRDWEPEKGIKFTLARRKSFNLLFDVSTPSGYQAHGLAEQRLRDMDLDTLEGLEIVVV